ncbi:hypothetical protein SAMN02744783_04752 [Serratia sp. CC22-02]|uniref:hypothetical protein n=1 Tax=Serratia sp. CC22-02 TaxID=1378076 RepID=UPI0024030CEE|nr:hypothetical protein [Serratia sp. CC22-02]SMP80921.1 hypothetical protein SAMN02744783_04752 [Serratia sp. CC22-02]
MTPDVILSQQIAGSNSARLKNTQEDAKKPAMARNPFVRGENVTGLALEFFIRHLNTALLPRAACDFLSKVCNVAAASDAYRLFYSKSTMAEKAGVSTRTVQRYMRAIEASGIMTRTAVCDSIKGHQPNLYTFTHEFISAVRNFFTVHLGEGRIKNIRKIAHSDLLNLVELALSPLRGLTHKISKFKDINTPSHPSPIGQTGASPKGQNDLQKEVQPLGKKEDQNLVRASGPNDRIVLTGKPLSITGAERRATISAELASTHFRRQAEESVLARAAYARRQRSMYLQGKVRTKQNPQSQYNHARLVAEGRRFDMELERSKAGALKDVEKIGNHLKNIRSLFREKPVSV